MASGVSVLIPLILFLLIDVFVFYSAVRLGQGRLSQKIFQWFAGITSIQMTATILVYGKIYNYLSFSLGVLHFLFLMTLIVTTLASYFWLQYAISSIIQKTSITKVGRYLYFIPLLVSLVACLVNPWTEWVLGFDDNMNYQRGEYFFLQWLCPSVYVVIAPFVAVYLIKRQHKDGAFSMFLKYFVFSVPAIVCTVFQVNHFKGGYPQIGISVALIMMYLDQYVQQIHEMRRLSSLESVNAQLNETMAQLQDNQVQLEYSATEQAVQLREIQMLNDEMKQKNEELQQMNDEMAQNLKVLESLSRSYVCLYLLDLTTGQFREIITAKREIIHDRVGVEGDARSQLFERSKEFVSREYDEEMTRFCDLDTLPDRLQNTDYLACQFFGNYDNWCRGAFVVADRDETGRCTHVLWTIREINQQVANEEAHRDELAQLRFMLSSSGIGTWKITTLEDGTPALFPDSKMKELLGISENDNLTPAETVAYFEERICKEDVEIFNTFRNKLMEGHNSELTFRWNHPTQGERFVRCGGLGKVTSRGIEENGYYYDVTEQTLKERALQYSQAANQAKTKFLQNMSHEIRTPLNAMFGFAQLLGMPDGSWTEEEKEQYNAYVYNSFSMMDLLISDILDSADSEHGNFRIHLEKMNVNEVCRNAMISVEFRRPGNVEMTFDTELDDDYMIVSDARRIQQVLVNYLTNACKFTAEGFIHMQCSKTQKPGYLTFSVTDTGRGVPLDKAEEIFGRFTKLHQEIQGSGLGLNICNTIAVKLEGAVYLDTSYTGGARFVFELKDNAAETD